MHFWLNMNFKKVFRHLIYNLLRYTIIVKNVFILSNLVCIKCQQNIFAEKSAKSGQFI